MTGGRNDKEGNVMNMVLTIYFWLVGLVCFARSAKETYYAESLYGLLTGLLGVMCSAFVVSVSVARVMGWWK